MSVKGGTQIQQYKKGIVPSNNHYKHILKYAKEGRLVGVGVECDTEVCIVILTCSRYESCLLPSSASSAASGPETDVNLPLLESSSAEF